MRLLGTASIHAISSQARGDAILCRRDILVRRESLLDTWILSTRQRSAKAVEPPELCILHHSALALRRAQRVLQWLAAYTLELHWVPA